MRIRSRLSLALFPLMLSLPAAAIEMIYAPPPPPIPEVALDEDGTPQKPVLSGAPSRGQLLYENHCTACHESVVHIRAHSAVRSLTDLRAQVGRWADNSKLRWSKEDVEDVARYLNGKYYQF